MSFSKWRVRAHDPWDLWLRKTEKHAETTIVLFALEVTENGASTLTVKLLSEGEAVLAVSWPLRAMSQLRRQQTKKRQSHKISWNFDTCVIMDTVTNDVRWAKLGIFLMTGRRHADDGSDESCQ